VCLKESKIILESGNINRSQKLQLNTASLVARSIAKTKADLARHCGAKARQIPPDSQNLQALPARLVDQLEIARLYKHSAA